MGFPGSTGCSRSARTARKPGEDLAEHEYMRIYVDSRVSQVQQEPKVIQGRLDLKDLEEGMGHQGRRARRAIKALLVKWYEQGLEI